MGQVGTTARICVMCNREVGKMEEQSGVCTVERGGTRDRTVVTGVRERRLQSMDNITVENQQGSVQ